MYDFNFITVLNVKIFFTNTLQVGGLQTLGVHDKLMTPVSELIASITPSRMILRQTKLSKTNCFLAFKGLFLGGLEKSSYGISTWWAHSLKK